MKTTRKSEWTNGQENTILFDPIYEMEMFASFNAKMLKTIFHDCKKHSKYAIEKFYKARKCWNGQCLSVDTAVVDANIDHTRASVVGFLAPT